MSHGSFATAINCMDGRTQIPVIDYIRKKYKGDYVDMITEPGPIRVLAENKDTRALSKLLGEQSKMALSASPNAAGVMKELFASEKSNGGLLERIKKFFNP